MTVSPDTIQLETLKAIMMDFGCNVPTVDVHTASYGNAPKYFHTPPTKGKGKGKVLEVV